MSCPFSQLLAVSVDACLFVESQDYLFPSPADRTRTHAHTHTQATTVRRLC